MSGGVIEIDCRAIVKAVPQPWGWSTSGSSLSESWSAGIKLCYIEVVGIGGGLVEIDCKTIVWSWSWSRRSRSIRMPSGIGRLVLFCTGVARTGGGVVVFDCRAEEMAWKIDLKFILTEIGWD